MTRGLLIARTELEDGSVRDVRIADGVIAAIGDLVPRDGERVIEANGGLLLPGLHDHHIHLAATAAALHSVRCGSEMDAAGFAEALDRPGDAWLRVTNYHESIAGPLDPAALDRLCPGRPVRVQHRTGRMWFFNNAGLDRLRAGGAPPSPRLDRVRGTLFDDDAWLRGALGSRPPSFAEVGRRLARMGVTGLTDMSPGNDATMAQHFASEIASGALPQRVTLAGRASLSHADMGARMTLGPVKLHLHEADLPPLDQAVATIAAAHGDARLVAIHCATEIELVFALAALREAGAAAGDRIEHASVAPDWAVAEIALLGLAVVTQPQFIAERGDAYATDVPPETHPLLYRLRAFLDAGVTLAGGSDAPFGEPDPWAAMAAAVSRRTPRGGVIGTAEALTPEQALDLFLRDPTALDHRREVTIGAPADLCLLDRPWVKMREVLSNAHVRVTIVSGAMVFGTHLVRLVQ